MLTASKLKNIEIKEKNYKAADYGGLYLLVKVNGRKYWRLKYRFLGKEKTLSIGVYGDKGSGVTLKQARIARDEAKELLAKDIDPSAFKQKEKEKKQSLAENSFAAMANEWLDKHAETLAEQTAKRKKAMLANDIVPYLGKRIISDIETFELVGCLNRIVDRGTVETAHKARSIINQVFRYAKQTGRIKHNPAYLSVLTRF